MRAIAIVVALTACGGARPAPVASESARDPQRCEHGTAELASLAGERRTAIVKSATDDRARELVRGLASDDKCRDAVAVFASDLARHKHAAWAAAKDASDFTAADDGYRLELMAQPDAPTAARDELYLADLWYARAEAEQGDAAVTSYRSAAIVFDSVVARGKVSPADLTEAAYAAVLARKAIWEADPEHDARDDDSGLRYAVALPLPEHAADLIAAFHTYAATLHGKSSPELVGMTYLEAALELRFHDVDNSIANLRSVIADQPETELAAHAAVLLFDAFTRAERFDDRAALAARLVADRTWLDANPELEAIVDAVFHER